MATLLEDIKAHSVWIVKVFGTDNINLDYSVESFKLLDNFFDQHSENGSARPGGRLSQNLGPILFSIGCYVGEVIIRNVPGSVWITDDNDPKGELNAEIKLPNETLITPMYRVVNRFKNGQEDALYGYGIVIVKEVSQKDYWDRQ